jgi:hypothetical protein
MRRFSALYSLLVSLLLFIPLAGAAASHAAIGVVSGVGPTTPYPILFVTQAPIPDDFTTINSVFGNQRADMSSAGRGGDLWIRYPDGTLKNLTLAAGYGENGQQGANAIAVRDPAVDWDGTKAIFSMVIGAPTEQYQVQTYFWQIYEITGLGQNQTPVITKVPNQPANFNNVSPIYATDNANGSSHIIFTSDRPRNGAAQLYPQLDEYEEAPTVTGVWSLDPATGDLQLLNHAPSGDFTPSIDSFGRVVFTQWDHLQRDQQADTDALRPAGQPVTYGTFNYADESATAAILNDNSEVFPEPRGARTDLLAGTNLVGHSFNHFFPWQMNEDGTELEILNHLGRHELHGYIPASINDDPNVIEYYGQLARFNPNPINNMLQVRESPTTPGVYYGIDAPEFTTHAAGQIISLNAPPTVNADHVKVTYITHRDTAETSDNPSPNHSGLYRDPLPLSDGALIAVHTAETRADRNEGTDANPVSRYQFRLQTLKQAVNGFMVADQLLTTSITKTVSWWDPDTLVSYSGPLWELQPVEVRARPRPARLTPTLPDPEKQVFTQAGVDPTQLQVFLTQNNLALIVSRNVTTRDDFDQQQPFNLRVAGTNTQTITGTGKIYDVAHLQIFQADQLRGLNFNSEPPRAGRRVLAQPLHDAASIANNLPDPNGPIGSVAVAADGSVAAFVPARRALSWQLTGTDSKAVVRERNWLSFQPGEIRVCTSCHGLSELDQAGHTAPTNQPQALLTLLQAWKAQNGSGGNATPTPTATTPTATPSPTAIPPQIAGCDIFPADNVWNIPIDTLPVDAHSVTYVNTIGATASFHADFGSGLFDGGPIGIPFIDVPGSQPKVTIHFNPDGYADQSDPGPYPVPANAPIEGGATSTGDRHVLVLEHDNCILYELYKAVPQQDGSWEVYASAQYDLHTHALRPATWTSADAAGLPILPGLVRYDEVASGEIKHAIRFTVPETRDTYLWPARHQASDLTGAQYPPMGQRFRLKASFDVSSFAPEVQVILRAMKKYGIILADNGSSWYISGAPDERWDNDVLHQLDQVTGGDFEAVDESSLLIDPNSGQVRANGNATPTPVPTVPPEGDLSKKTYLPFIRR